MEIQKIYKEQLYRLFINFKRLREKLSSLEKQVEELSSQQKILQSALNDNRYLEKELINKIEEEIGEKITPDILFEIIKEYEK